MARTPKTTYTITDDLSGEEISEEDAQSITFSYNGRNFELDLSSKNADKLDKLIAPYVDAAREVRLGKPPKKAPAPKRDLTAIREWAEKNGHGHHSRRIPGDVIEAYDAAH
jgi:hypothetical protein